MQIMSSGAVALQLFGQNGDQVRLQSNSTPTKTFSPPATRYVAAIPELTGVYSDPRAERSGPAQSGVAQRIIDSTQKILSTDALQFEVKAKALLEAALGRALGGNESFYDLSTHERSKLPKEVSSINRSIDQINLSLGMVISRPTEVNLDRTYSLDFSDGMKVLDRPNELRDLDMSNTEDRIKVVEYAIKFQANINAAGFRVAEQDKFASEMMAKSLEGSGIERDAKILESYVGLHRSRFENGEFSVIFDGVEISSQYHEATQS